MLWVIQRQLRSKKAEVRRRAVEQLYQAPQPRAFATLRKALGDADPEVRRLAASALGKLDDERVVEPLLGALRDRHAEVQRAAIAALKRVPGDRVQLALAPLLRNPDAGVRGQAAQALEFLGWHPPKREDEIWLLVAKGQCARAAAFGAAALPALELALNSSPYSLAVAVVQALGEVRDPRVIRLLLTALKASDPAVCVAAVDTLAKIGDLQALEPLIGMLRHANGSVRLAAVEALSSLGAATALEQLRALLRDPLWDVRRAVAQTLGRLKDTRAVEALTQSLSDADADVREATAMALGSLTDRRAIGPLVLALKDSTSGVRRIAAAALSRIDEDWSSSAEARAVVEQLKASLPENDPSVRHFVGQVLVSLGAATPEVTSITQFDGSSVSTPAKRRKLAVSLLQAILCDSDRDLRQAAAEALGRLGDGRAEPALLRAVGDADAGVRSAAEQALQSLSAPGSSQRA